MKVLTKDRSSLIIDVFIPLTDHCKHVRTCVHLKSGQKCNLDCFTILGCSSMHLLGSVERHLRRTEVNFTNE